MRFKSILGLLCAASSSAVMAGNASAQQTIKIGAILPLSGNAASAGVHGKAAIAAVRRRSIIGRRATLGAARGASGTTGASMRRRRPIDRLTTGVCAAAATCPPQPGVQC